MEGKITIRIDEAPASATMPNQRYRKETFWTTRRAATAQRQMAKAEALAQRPARWKPLAGGVWMRVHVAYGKFRRLPDLDASFGAIKGMVDGIVDAGILADDRVIRKAVITHEKLKGAAMKRHPGGFVEFTFGLMENRHE